MSHKLKKLLLLAGFERLSPLLALSLLFLGLFGLVSSLQVVTKSWPITTSCSICITTQLWDTLGNRIEKLRFAQNQDWPKYLDAIYSSTWSGTSLLQAILDCRNFAPRNALWAFDELEQDIAGGLDLDSALVNLKTRLANPTADRFVELSRLANLAGGRGYLAALRSQAIQLRMENATWLEVNAKRSWVVASARLAVFAPWLILIMLSMREETATAFTAGPGFTVLLVGLGASLLAFRLVKHLGKLPTQTRNLASR